MAWTADWDGDFLVGGDKGLRLTPNFKLREFKDEQGKVRAHRELVATLQLLRDRFKQSISVRGTDEDGLGATVSSTSNTQLFEAALAIKRLNFLETVEESPGGVRVRIADPGTTVEVDLEQALMTAFSVTAAFETVGNPFKQITGNFDGAGLSFGPSQWNFKSGTLVPLFKRFMEEDFELLKSCFVREGDEDDFEELMDVFDNRPRAEQIDWGNSISATDSLAHVIEPWKGYFRSVGDHELFRSIMVEESLRKYGALTLKEIKYLQSLAPEVQIDHLRAFCALYDLVIQQGGLDRGSTKSNIEKRVREEQPKDQLELVRIAVEERGRSANSEWRADAVSRRKGVLAGVPFTATETGKTRQRANMNFYMLRNVHIRDAKALMNSDVTEQLREVSRAIAQGKSLTAI